MNASPDSRIHEPTIAEKILRAIGRIVGEDKQKVFTHEDIRRAGNFKQPQWGTSYFPIIQGMRLDPGRAPTQAKKNRGVLKRVEHGRYVLTKYGRTRVYSDNSDDGEDGRHSTELEKIEASLDEHGYFNPKDQRDDRKRKLAEIAQRRGAGFRRRLVAAYGGRCAVTRCDAKAALEAAHILPYLGDKSDYVSNGILLRSDIHTLFDLDLLGIHPIKFTVELARSLRGTTYGALAGKKLLVPADPAKRPNSVALKRRWREFGG